jgi:hypothetical protein
MKLTWWLCWNSKNESNKKFNLTLIGLRNAPLIQRNGKNILFELLSCKAFDFSTTIEHKYISIEQIFKVTSTYRDTIRFTINVLMWENEK